MLKAHFILFVTDQERSKTFYEGVLNMKPRLHVNGMTEFELSEGTILGLMPEAGIKKLLGDKISHPADAKGIPRAEVYLLVKSPAEYLTRAKDAGAMELSPLEKRNWGHVAGYCSDPDGHVLAFAQCDA